jgi:hypothetical protein
VTASSELLLTGRMNTFKFWRNGGPRIDAKGDQSHICNVTEMFEGESEIH